MWAKVKKPDHKYGNYTIDVYLDDGSWEKYKESGLELKIREDKETGEKFVRFRRDPKKEIKGEMVEFGAPRVLIRDEEDGEYKEFDGLIGNGSFVNCKVSVYDSAKGKGHRLDTVAVETLVPYEGQSDEDMPF